MPLPIIANTHRVAVSGTCANGQEWANILHCRWTGAGTPTLTDITVMQNEVKRLWVGATFPPHAFARTFMPTAATIGQIASTALDGISATVVQTIALAGLDTNEALPAGVALCVTLRTASRGRSYRGRMYLGPWAEDANQPGGVVSSVLVGQMVGQLTGVMNSLLPLSWQLVVASYTLQIATPVTAITSNTQWDTQRRRMH